jgi:hypothetical protein
MAVSFELESEDEGVDGSVSTVEVRVGHWAEKIAKWRLHLCNVNSEHLQITLEEYLTEHSYVPHFSGYWHQSGAAIQWHKYYIEERRDAVPGLLAASPLTAWLIETLTLWWANCYQE